MRNELARFDDGYTRQRVWDGMPYEARWHYHAVVKRCCDTRRYDGVLPWPLALRCSDVPEPMDAVKVLIAAGLLADRGSDIVVLDIDHFLPPESERPENKLPASAPTQRSRGAASASVATTTGIALRKRARSSSKLASSGNPLG